MWGGHPCGSKGTPWGLGATGKKSACNPPAASAAPGAGASGMAARRLDHPAIHSQHPSVHLATACRLQSWTWARQTRRCVGARQGSQRTASGGPKGQSWLTGRLRKARAGAEIHCSRYQPCSHQVALASRAASRPPRRLRRGLACAPVVVDVTSCPPLRAPLHAGGRRLGCAGDRARRHGAVCADPDHS